MNLFTILFAAFLLGLLIWVIYRSKVKRSGFDVPVSFPKHWSSFLLEKVNFYKGLSAEERLRFESAVQHFLNRIRITGIGTEVNDEDRLLVASSAVIPIFAFPNWEYNKLWEVLLYPDTFSEAFEFEGQNREISGLVGSGGAIDHVVIFSKPALWLGFDNQSDKHNVGIHEFVHLFDKQDGDLDGIPSFFMENQAVLPWLRLIKTKTDEIQSGTSDINPYAALNEVEFLAVAAEYFFERPVLLQKNHPKLYEALYLIFQTDLAKEKKSGRVYGGIRKWPNLLPEL
ncbi:MAG: zinc-dependent peptidase [Algoriphagus sp.]|uniref:M90 family metallopeptidase n=1 Tax=Algoriphagus sp. TaxID=1872435 RepID=UPI002731C15F|nr:M90 family metallopeptidase [Algoriphagus sp.]MDP2041724.1 zinc-dependent peptidase [Algoriphagus sp.]MDP3473627.1 zinc-dependent peptidase [Algoriphagus sp.]